MRQFLGVHYYLGKDPKPRVVEAHVALIEPTGSEPWTIARAEGHLEYDPASPDGWVLSCLLYTSPSPRDS